MRVVLVRGLLCPEAGMALLRRRLRAAGFDVTEAKLDVLALSDVRRLATQVGEAVDRLPGDGPIALVGVSQGGLAALWYLRHLGGAAKIDRFVAVGAPFRGSWAVVLGLPTIGLVSAGLRQMLPGSAVLAELTDQPPPVPTVSIALAGDPIVPPSQATLPGVDALVLPGRRLPWVHQTLIADPRVASAVIDALRSPRGGGQPISA